MKKIILLLLTFISLQTSQAQTLQTFHDFQGFGILGDTINFSDYAGKKVLVVNTASYCSFTPQFADLVMLDSLYGGPGFAIMGFPCNDFGAQDPGDDSTIFGFCTNYYNVAFQMMSKVSIIAPDTAEVYKWLQLQSLNGVANAPVTWNFNKFCIDELGHWVMHFPSTVNPLDTAITNWINAPSVLGVNALPQTEKISLAGNPCRENITLNLQADKPEMINLSLIDMQGRLSFFQQTFAMKGVQKINIPAKDLEPGIYFLKAKNASFTTCLKVMLVR